jgi:acetyltransferase
MSVRHLEYLFSPQSVAVVGASNNPVSVGGVIMRNLLHGSFTGPIMPVNPKYPAVAGVLTYPNVASLPVAPDLAVICTPPRTIPEVVAQLGERGTKAAAVITAGLSDEYRDGKSINQAMLDAARPHTLRLLGPNCVGMLVPGIGLNATFAHTEINAGTLAFVSQSGGFCTATLDWAKARGIGFSHFVSLGNSADVDFGDVLDYLGSAAETNAILLYMESIGADEARKFMSAARSAARNKPVLAIKAGRNAEGARAAASHTGALAGADNVYAAALRRAGVLRVYDLDELFDAVETLARAKRLEGERLAILTNGGGPGVIATDALVENGGTLAEFSEPTLQRLGSTLPGTWSHGNPIDMVGDSNWETYIKSLQILFDEPTVDAILVMNAPQRDRAARSTPPARSSTSSSRPSSPCSPAGWAGWRRARLGRSFPKPTYLPTIPRRTPSALTCTWCATTATRRSSRRCPPRLPTDFTPTPGAARAVIEQALPRIASC